MSNTGYDFDTSAGLMPLIRALIKPPDEELNTQKAKKPQHPYYKRPGKGHNHDACDACGEGGDLICCDRCPASFHLGCYDPPLDENDIPAGLWLCRECRAAETDKPTSTRSSRAQSPIEIKSDEKKNKGSRNNRTHSKSKDKEEEKKTEDQKELSPMEVLVKAAKIMNPKQFELPREMKIPCLFPGTDKEGGKNGSSSLVTVDAWGCVPLPALSCFVCGGTCKAAPLLHCDYCPLLYHQDCLDPPLTALPTGRWMCPNHVEQYIDWKLVNSISATERVALWDKFSGPVDQHAIKLDFIRRAKNAHPPFRVKVREESRTQGRVCVPPMVRYHYQHPPPLLPSRREHMRCTNVLKKLKAAGEYVSDDEDNGRKHKICLNMSCPKYTGEGPCPRDSPPPKDVREQVVANDVKMIPDLKDEMSSESSELSELELENVTAGVKKRKISQEDKLPGRKGLRVDRLELVEEEDAEELLAMVDEQLQKLDERLVKFLAWQRLQQVALGEQACGRWRGSLPMWAEARVRRGVDRGRLARLGVRPVALPSDLLSRPDRERIAAAVWGPPPAPTPSSAPHPLWSVAAAAVRATLTPVLQPHRNGLERLGRPVGMRLARLSVGTSGGCDVTLDSALCHSVSPLHATIFYDEVSRQFELINYSEWGTRVNGVMYACDVTHDHAPPPPAPVGSAPSAAAASEPAEGDVAPSDPVHSLREFLSHRGANTHNSRRIVGGGSGARAGTVCGCRAPAAGAAWEGAALLPHGALLQFGCLMYVFSVTNTRSSRDQD